MLDNVNIAYYVDEEILAIPANMVVSAASNLAMRARGKTDRTMLLARENGDLLPQTSAIGDVCKPGERLILVEPEGLLDASLQIAELENEAVREFFAKICSEALDMYGSGNQFEAISIDWLAADPERFNPPYERAREKYPELEERARAFLEFRGLGIPPGQEH
jgi:hypothetical protein